MYVTLLFIGGEIDFSAFASENSGMTMAQAAIVEFMAVMLILMGTMVLINLFIAMMAKTFDTVSHKSIIEWSIAAARTIIEYDRMGLVCVSCICVLPYLLLCQCLCYNCECYNISYVVIFF